MLHTPGRLFFAGILVAMMLFKPGFAGTFIQSLGSVIQAAFLVEPISRPDPAPVETPRQEVVIEEFDPTRMLDERDQKLLSLFDKVFERLDRLEVKPAPAPELVVDPKVQQYREALERQELLERELGYSGDDPTIRKRYGLPPKVPSFDEFTVDGEITTELFDRMFSKKFPVARAQ